MPANNPNSHPHTARKATATPLKEAIDLWFRSNNLKTRFNETYLVAFWERMMGKSISSRTRNIYVKNKTLYLELDSAPLRNELLMAKNKLIKLLNDDMGEVVVEDVIFL